MKTHGIIRILMLSFLLTGWITVKGQQQVEVPGDNFSLEGALELFKKSSSPKQFEVMLNDAKNRVNNLDLNGDGYIDFIRVNDINEGNVHAFILQAVISDIENQDIAVITLEKLANGKAVLQITGDEDIYGIETIIEPTREVYTNAGYSSSRVVVNVWSWPSVRYIYGPHYSVWISPWGWYHRPHWWHTWRPVAYYDYYPYWRPYRHHYSVCYTQRVVYAHHIYRPHRSTSVIVHKRHHDRITHYRTTRIDNQGRYRSTRSRSNDRQINTAVRYDANGRIRSGSSQRVSRSSTSDLNRSQGMKEYTSSTRAKDSYSPRARSTSDYRNGSNNIKERSASIRRSTSSSRSSSGTSNGRTVNPQRNSSTSKMERTKTKAYDNSVRTNQSPKRSYTRSSESKQRSSANTNVQRSNKRSNGNSNIQRSKGSSSVHRSTGNVKIKRSSGGSSVQRSSGSSNARSSSGSSSIKRSSGNSSVKRSSGNASKNSSSPRSGNSSGQSRGRH